MESSLSDVEAKSFLKSNRYLLSTPNVVSLEFNDEEVDGKKTGRKIFRVGVIKKQPKENIKDPDIFIPKFLEHTKTSSNEVVHIPVEVVEEGELVFLTSDSEANPANSTACKGASVIKTADLENYGCLGANAQYRGSYRLLSAAHVLTNFNRAYIGNEILVRNDVGEYVEIGATVTDQVDVVLYETPTERNPEYVKQDLAWADITEDIGSSKIQEIGTPATIRRVRRDEYVKYYAGDSTDFDYNVKVENVNAYTKIAVKFLPERKKYVFFEDVCRIQPWIALMGERDSGTAIVAKDDHALLGILMAKPDRSRSYYFCKLELD